MEWWVQIGSGWGVGLDRGVWVLGGQVRTGTSYRYRYRYIVQAGL